MLYCDGTTRPPRLTPPTNLIPVSHALPSVRVQFLEIPSHPQVSSLCCHSRATQHLLTAKTLRLNFYNHAHFPPVSAPPPFLPDPWQALLCSHLHNFIIARMLCKNHTVWKLLGLASFLLSIISWRFIKVVRCSWFLFITESGSMVWTNHSLTIQPLEGIWITFSF